MRFLGIILMIVAVCFSALGQTNDIGITTTMAMGEVVKISPQTIDLKTKDGEIAVSILTKTAFKRVAPGVIDLKNTTAAAQTDVQIGDKLLVTGLVSDDKKKITSKTVFLMSKSDIEEHHKREAADWRARGIAGKITAIDASNSTVSVDVKSLAATTKISVKTKEKAEIKRYSPNSVNYSAAVPSSFSEIKVGDSIRALGDRSADGNSFAAEKIVTGAFQTTIGTIKSIDTAKNTLIITNTQTKKDSEVDVSHVSLMKRFPDMAAMFSGAGPVAPQTGAAPATGGAPRQRGLDEMIDNFPTVTISELKVGDTIAVSSNKYGANDKITAIKFLAGIEFILRSSGGSQSGGGMRGGQGGGMQTGGFEGFEFP